MGQLQKRGNTYPTRQEIETFQNQLTPSTIKQLAKKMDEEKLDSV